MTLNTVLEIIDNAIANNEEMGRTALENFITREDAYTYTTAANALLNVKNNILKEMLKEFTIELK